MIDLHCHSTVSGGMLFPTKVVRLARQNGCTLLALADHGHTGGLAETRTEADTLGLPFINGVEISVTWRGRTIHIVGLDFDEHNETLQNPPAEVRRGRLKRLKAVAAKLEKEGVTSAYEDALALAANKEMVSRTHITGFLIRADHIKNRQQAFTKYLGDGEPYSVRHEWATLEDRVAVITGTGSMAITAHPIRRELSTTTKRNLFQEFRNLDGVGTEVHSGNCCKNDRLNYALLADRFDFLTSAGSDFHRPNGFSGGILGTYPDLPERCRPIWEHLKAV